MCERKVIDCKKMCILYRKQIVYTMSGLVWNRHESYVQCGCVGPTRTNSTCA